MGSKKPPPQEMAQLDSSDRSSSPFWRSRPQSNSQSSFGKARNYDPSIVVGASYSHADILKIDDLSLSSSMRPRTPPSSAKTPRFASTPPTSKSGPSISKTPERSRNSQSSAADAFSWSTADDDEDDDQLGFDEDEDEFGLPSVTSSRRMAKRSGKTAAVPRDGKSHPKKDTPRLSGIGSPGKLGPDVSDIAELRGGPTYPSTSKPAGKILRPQYKEILRDPASSLHLIQHSPLQPNATPKETEARSTRISRINKFKKILQATSISLSDLRDCAWSGVPQEVRSMTWQVLLGYLPTSAERRVTTLERKRKEYLEGIRQAFEKSTSGLIAPVSGRSKSAYSQGRTRGLDENVWHQISIDVPRTSPHIELYGYEATQRSLERILYLWAIRHPTSGYVQGINDLVTPFWQVFLGAYISDPDIETGMDPGQLPKSVIDAVEADSYWCLTKLLDGIQDNYIYAQPGIVRQVGALKDLVSRIDGGLAKHLENEGVEFMQFSFRWMNCLLMREVNVRCTIRMWDTYLAEEQGFSEFHLYVCAAFLVKWTEKLVKMEFQEIMMYLQALPTKDWNEKDVELLLSEAFIWQSLFKGSSAHLRNGGQSAVVT